MDKRVKRARNTVSQTGGEVEGWWRIHAEQFWESMGWMYPVGSLKPAGEMFCRPSPPSPRGCPGIFRCIFYCGCETTREKERWMEIEMDTVGLQQGLILHGMYFSLLHSWSPAPPLHLFADAFISGIWHQYWHLADLSVYLVTRLWRQVAMLVRRPPWRHDKQGSSLFTPKLCLHVIYFGPGAEVGFQQQWQCL